MMRNATRFKMNRLIRMGREQIFKPPMPNQCPSQGVKNDLAYYKHMEEVYSCGSCQEQAFSVLDVLM